MFKWLKNLFKSESILLYDDTEVRDNTEVKYFCIISKKYVTESQIHSLYKNVKIFHDMYQLNDNTILCLSKESHDRLYVKREEN